MVAMDVNDPKIKEGLDRLIKSIRRRHEEDGHHQAEQRAVERRRRGEEQRALFEAILAKANPKRKA